MVSKSVHKIAHVFSLAFMGRSLLFIVLLAGAPFPALAQFSGHCAAELREAEQSYVRGTFSRTVRLVESCLDGRALETEARVRAYRLLTLAYLQQGDTENARVAAVRLLRAAPGYTPDPVQDPPSYVALLTIVEQDLRAEGALPPAEEEQKSWLARRTTWLAVGGGLLIAGIIAIFAGGGG